jgi:hypothetical protein
LIWKLQQVDGSGWVRDWHAARPIVTAREEEAFEFASWIDAAAVVPLLPKEVAWRVVKREASVDPSFSQYG